MTNGAEPLIYFLIKHRTCIKMQILPSYLNLNFRILYFINSSCLNYKTGRQSKMVIPNDFLVNIVEHNNIVSGCFCEICRNQRVLRFSRHGIAQLYELFKIDVRFSVEYPITNFKRVFLRSCFFVAARMIS